LAGKLDDLDGTEAEVTVTADDNASTTIDEVEDAVSDLDGTTAEATLSAEDKAKAEIDEVMDRLKDLDGEEVAAVLNAKAAKLEAEIKRANGLLADLDAETAAPIIDARDQATVKLDAIRGRITDLDTGFTHVDDQSRSVGANFAGNLISEMPGVSSALGPLNMAVGQFAEYAAEGNINFKNFLKTAGPIAALSGAFMLMQDYMGRIAATKAWRKEQVESYREAIEEVGVGVGAIEEHLTGIEDWNFTAAGDWNDFFGASAEIPNVVAGLGAMGVSYETTTQAIAGGTEATALFQEQVGQYGDAGAPYLEWMTEQQGAYATATAESAAETDFFTQSQESADRALQGFLDNENPLQRFGSQFRTLMDDMRDGSIDTEAAADALDYLAEQGIPVEEALGIANDALNEEVTAAEAAADAIDSHVEALEGEIEALEEAIELNEEYIGAQQTAYETEVAYTDARLEARDATDEYTAAQAAYLQVMQDTPEDIEAVEDAERARNDAGRDVLDTIYDEAAAYADLQEATALASGAAYTEAQRVRDTNLAYVQSAATIDASLLPGLAHLIATYNGIPEQETTILQMLQSGKTPEEIAAEINAVSGTYTAAVEMDVNDASLAAADAELNYITNKKRTAYIGARGPGTAGYGYGYEAAAGNPSTPGGIVGLVGEEGPELVTLPAGSEITNARRTAEDFRNGGGGSTTNNYYNTVNLPAGVNPSSYVIAKNRYDRRNGT